MPIDPDVGGPSVLERQAVYARMNLTSSQARQIENMVLGSPAREVGAGALRNVFVRHQSVKNGTSRLVESHTCELISAYAKEMDPTVLGYYTQVPCARVARITSAGRPHISHATLDFLVFRENRIDLEECKPEDKLEELSKEPDSLWRKNADRWTYSPYAEWARQYGLTFSVWTPPHPFGLYLQNLEASYAFLRAELAKCEQRAVHNAAEKLAKGPCTIEELKWLDSSFNERLALWMMANRAAYGTWKSTPLVLADRFTLYADSEQAELADEVYLRASAAGMAQPDIHDPLLNASATDLAKARNRLDRLTRINEGKLPPTDRMRDLAVHMARVVASGGSPLSACLTRYSSCGNPRSRLLQEQEQASETVIVRFWNTGKVLKPRDLMFEYEAECARLGVPASGRTSLDVRRRRLDPTRRALATGGLRSYQGTRPRTDATCRSLPALGYGHTLYVDSSDLDNRTAPNLAELFPAAKAKFYIGLDGATLEPMAHSLIFGSARTDGLALLIREYVHRHGFLPRLIHLDRGSENKSGWTKEFCVGQISLRYSPSAGSAWNGAAENAIKQVNEQVAHQLRGSTAPDQKGRNVDGRFKSRANARTAFITILEQFKAFIYGDLPRTPGADGGTPAERREEALALLGYMGTPCEWNDDFLIRTSIRVKYTGRATERSGIRTKEGYFTSGALQRELRTHQPDEVRSDCADPSVMYVKIRQTWFKAFHERVQSIAMQSSTEKLFALLYEPFLRSEASKRGLVVARERYGRIKHANVARPANEHLAPSSQDEDAGAEVSPPTESLPSWQDILPFDETEDR